MVSVPLKASCSNMCARPVLPIGSWAEPMSTLVKNEKTGAESGRWQTTAVRPFGSFLTRTRFSNDAKSWAEQIPAMNKTRAGNLRMRDKGPPKEPERNQSTRDVKHDLK